jgi:hypothetical protein
MPPEAHPVPFAIALLLAASHASAQNLTLVDPESAAVLARTLAKFAGTSQRLLKYSCLETIERSYFTDPAAKKLGAHALT